MPTLNVNYLILKNTASPTVEVGLARCMNERYAFLANLLWAPIDLPMRAHALMLPNLQAYCQRMKARYYAT